MLLNYINVCFEKWGKLKLIYWSVSITNGNAAISVFLSHSLVLQQAMILKEFISMLKILSKFRKIVHVPAKVCTFQTKDSLPCFCILFHCFKILYTNKNSMWSRRKTEWKELKFSFFVFQRQSLQHSAIIVYLSTSV